MVNSVLGVIFDENKYKFTKIVKVASAVFIMLSFSSIIISKPDLALPVIEEKTAFEFDFDGETKRIFAKNLAEGIQKYIQKEYEINADVSAEFEIKDGETDIENITIISDGFGAVAKAEIGNFIKYTYGAKTTFEDRK